MIANRTGEGAHLLDVLWLCALGDVTNLRRIRLQCRNSGQKIAEHEISEMIEYLEASKTKGKNDGGWGSCSGGWDHPRTRKLCIVVWRLTLRTFDMPLRSCIQAVSRSCFSFLKVAGFDALNSDHHWLVLTDR
jgi:hypothetical protein